MRLLLIEPSDNHHETVLTLIAYASRLPVLSSLWVAVPERWKGLYARLPEVNGIVELGGDLSVEHLIREVRKQELSHVLYNTAYGPLPFRLSQRLRSAFQTGIVHDTEKLHRFSWVGWAVGCRMQHFWVLRDRLWQTLPRWWRKKSLSLPLAALPSSLEAALPSIAVPPGERWFAIPGRIERKRRAYEDLIEALKERRPSANWRFLLLGPARAPHSDWPFLQERIRRYGIEEYFLVFEEPLDFATYHGYLRVCEAVLPLIHPTIAYWEKYLKYQITGAFSLAFTHRKPLFLHRAFSSEREFMDTAFFYETPLSLIELIERGDSSGHFQLYQSEQWRVEWGVERLWRGLTGGERRSSDPLL
ncbi:MAG: hypothetical protein N2170_07275 [Bacteroidia bacterium]|nr:hypothetical protein [Bacteroidia bacterium]